jgi:hypothetical protein
VTHRAPNGDSFSVLASLTGADCLEDLSMDGTLAHVLPDTGAWEDLLLKASARGEPWTDPGFPPDDSSLFRDPAGELPDWAHKVKGWARVKDVFHRSHVMRLTFCEDHGAAPKCYGYDSHAEAAPRVEVKESALSCALVACSSLPLAASATCCHAFSSLRTFLAGPQVPTMSRGAAAAAVRAATKLVEAGFAAARFGADPHSGQDGQDAVAALVQAGGPMGAKLAESDVFGKIDRTLR